MTKTTTTNTPEDRFFVALGALKPDPKNVRRYNSDDGITELAASIKAEGLIQNLAVRPGTKKGQWFVTAGARRLKALKTLAAEGATIQPTGQKVDNAFKVPVFGLSDQHNAVSVSLAENFTRQNMNVADEVEAFRKLIEEENMTPEGVADRFGISHMTVRRRVKLAKVSPRIMDEFREGRATLQQLEALAVADDHAAQEEAFFSLPDYSRHARNIKERLTNDKLRADHRLVAFISMDAYTEAGGTITKDLFSEEGDFYLDNKPLVMRLATEKLTAKAEEIRAAEGWKWGEAFLSRADRPDVRMTIARNKRDMTEAESAEAEQIAVWLDENSAAYEAQQMTEEESAEVEAKYQRLDEIEAGCYFYDAEEIPFAGVHVTLDYEGDMEIRRGLVKIEDAHELEALRRAKRYAELEAEGEAGAEDDTGEGAAAQEPTEVEAEGYSAALTDDLTLTRTVALAFEVSQRPDVALAMTVHALALRSLYPTPYYGGGYTGDMTCVRLTGSKQLRAAAQKDEDNQSAFEAWDEAKERLAAILPAEKADLWDWCMSADRKTLMDVLAFCVADQIDAQATNTTATNLKLSRKIESAVAFDMARWWKPSSSFLKRITKKMMAGIMGETGASPEAVKAVADQSKSDAILTVLEHIEGKGWTPPAIRSQPAQEAEAQPEADAGEDAQSAAIAAE